MVIALIYFNCSSSLWARLTLPHTKHHLKMAVGGSWSSAGLSPGKSNNISNGPERIGIGNQTRGVAPLGPARGWPRTGLRAQPATATLATHAPGFRRRGASYFVLSPSKNKRWFGPCLVARQQPTLGFSCLGFGKEIMPRPVIWSGWVCNVQLYFYCVLLKPCSNFCRNLQWYYIF
jgi:hypothetical protein